MDAEKKAGEILYSLQVGLGLDEYTSYKLANSIIDHIQESLIYGKLHDSPYTTLEARQFYVEVRAAINKTNPNA